MATKIRLAAKTWRAIFATVFGIAFVAHTLADFRKFLRGDTTMTSTIEERKQIAYPVATVCPGNPFNYSAMRELGLHPNFWVNSKMTEEYFKRPTDLTELQYWWDESTLPEQSIVTRVTHFTRMRPVKTAAVVTRPLSTVFFGKCFLYEFNRPFDGSKEDHIVMAFKFPPTMDFLTVRIHEMTEEKWQIGFNIWEKTPNNVIVRPETSSVISKITLKKETK